MVPKSGSRLPKSLFALSDVEFAGAIGDALQSELGGSHRAAKTVMAWTGVSNRTARAWLNGQTCPSGLHLLVLAGHCRAVMGMVLNLTGHDQIAVVLDVDAIESALETSLAALRNLKAERR